MLLFSLQISRLSRETYNVTYSRSGSTTSGPFYSNNGATITGDAYSSGISQLMATCGKRLVANENRVPNTGVQNDGLNNGNNTAETTYASAISYLSSKTYGTWSDAYKAFVLNSGYLSSGQSYDTNEEDYGAVKIAFALHDFNGDGVPELLANSGYYAAGVSKYLYRFIGGRTSFFSDTMESRATVYVTGNPSFPGLFASSVSAGDTGTAYHMMKNGSVFIEKVQNLRGTEVIWQTTNKDLLNAWNHVIL